MSLETVRINQRGKNQLTTLKRRTKIENWNILCRWAFCLSIAEQGKPRPGTAKGDAAVEMTWKTFGGEYADIYLGLLKHRCLEDGLELDEDTLSEQLKLHLHRGIGYLSSKKGAHSVEGMVELAVDS